jgi:hypothetical protein
LVLTGGTENEMGEMEEKSFGQSSTKTIEPFLVPE